MKTAMQLMLEDLELRYKVLSNAEMLQGCGAIEGTIDYAKSLIIKEKEQIIDFHVMLMKKGLEQEGNEIEWNYDELKKEAEQYFNQTYNKPIL
jgi:hypothetical protein